MAKDNWCSAGRIPWRLWTMAPAQQGDSTEKGSLFYKEILCLELKIKYTYKYHLHCWAKIDINSETSVPPKSIAEELPPWKMFFVCLFVCKKIA